MPRLYPVIAALADDRHFVFWGIGFEENQPLTIMGVSEVRNLSSSTMVAERTHERPSLTDSSNRALARWAASEKIHKRVFKARRRLCTCCVGVVG